MAESVSFSPDVSRGAEMKALNVGISPRFVFVSGVVLHGMAWQDIPAGKLSISSKKCSYMSK